MSIIVKVRRNWAEYVIIYVTLMFNIMVIYPLMFDAMIHDLMNGTPYVTAMNTNFGYVRLRYISLIIIMTLVGQTAGFAWIQEVKSLFVKQRAQGTMTKRQLDNAITKAFNVGALFAFLIASVIALEVLALWYFHIKEVGVLLLNLSVKSGIWLLITLMNSLIMSLGLLAIRRRKVGKGAIVSH